MNPMIERLKARREELQGTLDQIVTRHDDNSKPNEAERKIFEETRTQLESSTAGCASWRRARRRGRRTST